MVKVKNPQLPVYEILAYENPEDPYTLGDAWRGTLTEGYLQNFDDENYTVKKSSRGERPSQQGFDLEIQMKWREAFAACVDVWRNLPNECPVSQSCHVGASKQSVWAAKEEYGVVCSYYDLFMSCCLKSFRESEDWSFNPEDCFPCAEMLCSGVEIGYTTQQMSVGEEQELTAIGVSAGVECTWEIDSGGGSLSGNTGESVVYTAPDSNPDCDENPIISLSVCGVVCATLDIAVNAVSGVAGYLAGCTTGRVLAICTWWRNKRNYYCDGTISEVVDPICGSHSKPCGVGQYYEWLVSGCLEAIAYCNENCPDGCEDGYHDTRSDEQKAAGCCPEQAL